MARIFALCEASPSATVNAATVARTLVFPPVRRVQDVLRIWQVLGVATKASGSTPDGDGDCKRAMSKCHRYLGCSICPSVLGTYRALAQLTKAGASAQLKAAGPGSTLALRAETQRGCAIALEHYRESRQTTEVSTARLTVDLLLSLMSSSSSPATVKSLAAALSATDPYKDAQLADIKRRLYEVKQVLTGWGIIAQVRESAEDHAVITYACVVPPGQQQSLYT